MAASQSGGEVTVTDAKKALAIFTKAGLMRTMGKSEEGDVLWEVKPVSEDEMLWAVDRAMLVRLLSGAQESGLNSAKEILLPLFLSEHSKGEFDTLLKETNLILHRLNRPD